LSLDPATARETAETTEENEARGNLHVIKEMKKMNHGQVSKLRSALGK
jgi:hypothetical protein